MDTQNLKAFVAVAELRSFSHAAEQLHITQPAISKRIAALENELDATLFDRIARNTQLTESGAALLPRAKAILMDIEDASRALKNITGSIGGKLCIGTSHHIGLHRLAPALKAFTKQYPEVQLDLVFLDSEEGCHQVLNGTLELAIVTLPFQPLPKLITRTVWDDPLRITFAHDHPLSAMEAPDLKALSEYPAILPAEGTFTRNIIERALKAHKLPLKVNMETNYLETIKMMVSIGLGWSALPQTMTNGLHTANIESLKLNRTLGTVIHKERTLSNAAQALIELL